MNNQREHVMKTIIPLLLLTASLVSLIAGMASPLLAVSSRVVVGFGRVEFAAVDFAETLSIPQTVARLGHDGEVVLMVVVVLSCMVFPVLKIGILCAQSFGRGPRAGSHSLSPGGRKMPPRSITNRV